MQSLPAGWSSNDDEALRAFARAGAEQANRGTPASTTTLPRWKLKDKCSCDSCFSKRFWREHLLAHLADQSSWQDGWTVPERVMEIDGLRLISSDRLAVLRAAGEILELLGALVDGLDDRNR